MKRDITNNNDIKTFVTLGPSSFKKEIIQKIEKESVDYFRINLSHTPASQIEKTINMVKSYSHIPICLDSEGAQMRTQSMKDNEVMFYKGDTIKVFFDEVEGTSNSISFHPNYVSKQFEINDEIKIDFNTASIKLIEKNKNYWYATVLSEGTVGSNKAANINKDIHLDSLTEKDKIAVDIGKKMGVRHFALSFASSKQDVLYMKQLIGNDSQLISKIESRKGLKNLRSIIEASDNILIDRGDLSREVCIEKIPFLQRIIISTAKKMNTPVHVATNLLESMLNISEPNRGEVNDVVSTLLSGANGLALAAETAIGKYPVEAVKIVRKIIKLVYSWDPDNKVEDYI